MASRSSFGAWFYGFLLGGVVGAAACAGAAFYITKAPIPFVNKVDQASDKINPLANGQPMDPNLPLNKEAPAPANLPASKVTTVEAQTPETVEQAPVAQPEETSRYVVQAGAFRTEQAAEGRRAELGMLGLESRIIPRTDNNRTLYRVRLGPYGTMDEASQIKGRLIESGIQADIGKLK